MVDHLEEDIYEYSPWVIPMSSVGGYLYQVRKFESVNINIGPIAARILDQFVRKSDFSAYDIYSNLKTTELKMAYKNIHKRIQRLYSLNLIGRVERSSQRSAKYFQLTPEGVYYFLRKWRDAGVMKNGKEIFENYGNDDAFKVFLYPYLNYETIIQIDSQEVYVRILEYMRECCNEIQSVLERMKSDGINFDSAVQNDTNTISYGIIVIKIIDSTIKNKLVLHLLSGLIYELEHLKEQKKLLLLANDNKFMSVLEEIHDKYDKAYNDLIDLRVKS